MRNLYLDEVCSHIVANPWRQGKASKNSCVGLEAQCERKIAMPRSCYILFLVFGICVSISAQSLTTVILPKYIEGVNGTNSNRIPFAYWARLNGLLANATYRFSNQIINSSDASTTNGAGNCIFSAPAGDFLRTSNPGLTAAGNYGTFKTDATGSYEGWFITEPTGNARFVPGKYIFIRIALNDGGSGTSVDLRLTSKDSVCVVKLDPTASDSSGTGLRCTSAAIPKDFVFAYDNTSGSGRPISGSFVESDGTDNSTANNYAGFYANGVNGINGAFGFVLPNTLVSGIRRIERRSLADGAIIAVATDMDGVWPSGANTINPSGGTAEIILAGTDVSWVTGVHQAEGVPTRFALSQNYPNPFNPTTNISFTLPSESRVRLEVFSLIGQLLATLIDDWRPAGRYAVTFNGSHLPSGIYFYKLTAGTFVQTKQMTLIK
jgi:hypothetical protein